MSGFLEIFGWLVTLYVNMHVIEGCHLGLDVVGTVMETVVMHEGISCHCAGLARDSAGCSEV
jgi:hypothetical protein